MGIHPGVLMDLTPQASRGWAQELGRLSFVYLSALARREATPIKRERATHRSAPDALDLGGVRGLCGGGRRDLPSAASLRPTAGLALARVSMATSAGRGGVGGLAGRGQGGVRQWRRRQPRQPLASRPAKAAGKLQIVARLKGHYSDDAADAIAVSAMRPPRRHPLASATLGALSALGTA